MTRSFAIFGFSYLLAACATVSPTTTSHPAAVEEGHRRDRLPRSGDVTLFGARGATLPALVVHSSQMCSSSDSGRTVRISFHAPLDGVYNLRLFANGQSSQRELVVEGNAREIGDFGHDLGCLLRLRPTARVDLLQVQRWEIFCDADGNCEDALVGVNTPVTVRDEQGRTETLHPAGTGYTGMYVLNP